MLKWRAAVVAGVIGAPALTGCAGDAGGASAGGVAVPMVTDLPVETGVPTVTPSLHVIKPYETPPPTSTEEALRYATGVLENYRATYSAVLAAPASTHLDASFVTDLRGGPDNHLVASFGSVSINECIDIGELVLHKRDGSTAAVAGQAKGVMNTFVAYAPTSTRWVVVESKYVRDSAGGVVMC